MLVYIANFLIAVALVMSFVYMPVFVTEITGSVKYAGIALSFYQIFYFFSGVFLGRAGDFIKRKWLMIIGIFLGTTGFLFLYFIKNFFQILLLRIIAGIGMGMLPGAMTAYVYEQKMHLGFFTALGSLGWGTGSLITGVIGFKKELFFIISSILLLSSVLLFFLKEQKFKPLKAKFFSFEVVRKNLRLYFSFFLRHTGAFAVWAVYPLFLRALGANALWIGIIYSVNPFLQSIFMLFVRKLDSELAVKLGLFLSFVTFILFYKAVNHFEILPYQVVLASSWSLLYLGSLYYLLKKNIERSTVTGVLNGISGLCGTIGPLIGGYLAEISLRTPIIFALFMSAAGLFVFSKK